MLRNILAAIAGYVAMAASLFVLFFLLWMALGPSVAFQPGSWEISASWTAWSAAASLLAALLGGLACAKVARDRKAVWMLMGLVVALGVVEALTSAEMAAGPRPDDVTMMEATVSGVQPGWLLWLYPVLGVVGVWFGSRRLR